MKKIFGVFCPRTSGEEKVEKTSTDGGNSCKRRWGLGLPARYETGYVPTQSLSSSPPSWAAERPFRFVMIYLSLPTLKVLKDIQ